MSSSLPDYSRFAEATIQRVRKDRKRKNFDRPARMLFNVLLLAGLWGVPLYGRWMILTDLNITHVLSEDILGKWQIGNKDSKSFLEFAPKQLRLIRNNDVLIASAEYQLVGDALWVSNFKDQPGDRPLPTKPQCYQISLRDDRLIVKPANTGFTPIPDHAAMEESSLRLVLPPWQGVIRRFQRADNPE